MRKVLLCAAFMLLATTLVAKEAVLRVGYLLSPSVSSLEENVISCVTQVLVEHPSLEEMANARLFRENEKAYQEKVHSALKVDNWKTVSKAKVEENVNNIENIKIEFEFWDKAELKNDEAEHIIRTNSLDLLFAITGTNDGSLLDYTITLFTLDGNVEILNTLAIIQKVQDESEKIIKALSSHFLTEYSYIKLNNMPSNLVIYLDGVKTEIKNSLIFVTPGLHTLHFSSINKETEKVEIETVNGEIKEVDLVFTSLTFPPLELVTIPSDAQINVQGMDGVVGHYLSQSQSLPFAINSQREGFADLNLQINKPILAQNLELRPKWMDNDSRMKNAKDDMYRSLRNTILSFASYVLVTSLENIYPDEFGAYSTPVKLTFSSISIISLLDFFYKSGKYYHAAEQTYY